MCAFAHVSSVGVSELQGWDTQPQACEELFLSSSVMQLCFELKSSAKVKVQYLRKLNQKKLNVSVMCFKKGLFTVLFIEIEGG